MIGIDVLKSDVINIAKILSKVDKAMEDDKVTFIEGIGLSFEIPKVFLIIKTYKGLIKEVKELDEAELKEVSEAFAIEFDLKNDEAELMVEQIIEVIVTTAAAIINSKSIQK